MPRLPENLDVLRDGAFRRVLGAAAVSWFGDRMVTVALAFAVLAIDGSASSIGIVLAVRSGALLVSLLLGGVVADRVSRRAIMVCADVARLATQGLLAGLVIAGGADVWSVALLSGLTGIATGFFNPASTGLLPAIVAPEQLQQANGVRATMMSAGEIGGPVLAGALVAAVGAGWALAVDAATFGASALLLTGVRVPRAVERAASGFWDDLREGWTTFRGTTWVWTFVLWASFANVTWGAWSVLGPLVAERELGGPAVWGALNAALGAGALIGAPRRDPPDAAPSRARRRADGLRAGAGAAPARRGRPRRPAGRRRARLRRRDDVRQHRVGVGAAAPHPAGGALAGQRLRLVRLVGLRPRRARDLGAARGRRSASSEALALSGVLSVLSATALVCVRDVRRVRA